MAAFFLAIWKFLKAVPLWLYGLIALAGAFWWWGNARYNVGVTVTEAKHAQALQEAERKARLIEDTLIGKVYDLAYSAEMRRKQRETDTNARERCLLDGTCRMRDRFTCPRLPQGSGATASDDAAEGFGLLPEDGRFLVSEAARADQNTDDLQTCQAYVEAVREAVNGR